MFNCCLFTVKSSLTCTQFTSTLHIYQGKPPYKTIPRRTFINSIGTFIQSLHQFDVNIRIKIAQVAQSMFYNMLVVQTCPKWIVCLPIRSTTLAEKMQTIPQNLQLYSGFRPKLKKLTYFIALVNIFPTFPNLSTCLKVSHKISSLHVFVASCLSRP